MHRCPNCSGEVVVEEVVVEVIGRTRVVKEVGRCRWCGARLTFRHEHAPRSWAWFRA